MSKFLLDERFAPTMSEMGFLEFDATKVRDAYVDWQSRIHPDRAVRAREVAGTLPDRLESLLPLTSTEIRRTLLLPTRSRWTAYLENGWRGTDASPDVSYLCTVLGCRGLRAVSVDNTSTSERIGTRGRYGATILDTYTAKPEGPTVSNTGRSIYAANDGGRWVFGADGTPFPFEDLRAYEARRIRDRFTHEMLDRYLRELGIRMFDADFFETDEPAYLVEKHGPTYPGMREYTLDEARADW